MSYEILKTIPYKHYVTIKKYSEERLENIVSNILQETDSTRMYKFQGQAEEIKKLVKQLEIYNKNNGE